MKTCKVCFVLAFFMVSVLALTVPRWALAAGEEKLGSGDMEGARGEIHKLEASIAEDRDKIIAESGAIREDRRKIKNAEKLSDKAEAVRIKEEAAQDIKKREAAIKELKSSISLKKEQRGVFLYGQGQKIERREAGR